MRGFVFSIICFLLALSITSACTPRDKRFNFVFKYGVGAKNEMDTRNDTFTKDMIGKPSIKFKLQLSDEEKQQVDSMLKEMHFEHIPSGEVPITGKVAGRQIPCSTFILEVNFNGRKKKVQWDDCVFGTPSNSPHDQLLNLATFIITTIENKKEYKESPKPKGGYL